MKKEKYPVTTAIRQLKEFGAEFQVKPYPYIEKGGTAAASAALGVPEHQVIKTLVFEDETHTALLVLMHGDRQVSEKMLARSLNVKAVHPCDTQTAERLTGYQVGGISPFGTRKVLPVWVEQTILDLPSICINAGKRGLLMEISPNTLVQVLKAKPVNVAI